MRLRIPTEEAELRDHLDRILDKGLSCGPMNQMLLGMTDLSHHDNRMSISSVDTNTHTYAGRNNPPDPSPDK